MSQHTTTMTPLETELQIPVGDLIIPMSEVSTILRILLIFGDEKGPDQRDLFWVIEDGKLKFLVSSNDLSTWDSADAEPITSQNIDALEKAVQDMKEVSPDGSSMEAHLLFCCRESGIRPQKSYYQHIPEYLHELFNACGPERDRGITQQEAVELIRRMVWERR